MGAQALAFVTPTQLARASMRPREHGFTEVQTKAMRWLHGKGGEGAIDKRGAVVAAGEVGDFGAVTWLRLVSLGALEAAGPYRVRLTRKGAEAAAGEPSGGVLKA